MPHHADDNRHAHLQLVAEEANPDRRRQPAPPSPPPDRGSRRDFAGELRRSLDHLEKEAEQRPAPPSGIHPHLVFRIPLARNASTQAVAELLNRLDINVVGIERDRAIIAFRDESDLSDFRSAVNAYEQGPRINARTGAPYAST